MQEDNLINILSRSLRNKRFNVLAAGGNQAGLFKFHTDNGKRKAPDLVAYKDKNLIVVEAKTNPKALFRGNKEYQSDIEVMENLSKSKIAQKEIMTKAIKVLKGLGIQPDDLTVIPCILTIKDNWIIKKSPSLQNIVLILMDESDRNYSIIGPYGIF